MVEITTSTIFENDPKMIPRLVPIVELENVSVLQTVEDADFVQHLLPAILFNGLNGDIVDGLFLAALITNSNYEFKYHVKQNGVTLFMDSEHNAELRIKPIQSSDCGPE